jgi:type IV secretory pathway VirB4 component
MATASSSKTTQDFVPLKEIRDGIVILKDGSLRGVLIASSINLALKSQDEQAATLAQFQNFLNSLDFSVQFVVHSRELDIRPYIALLEERHKEQINDLMKIQTREYIEFVKSFTESSNIMTKTFFIVIPYSASIIQHQSGVKKIFGRGGKTETQKEKEAGSFQENRTQLEQRISVVEQGLVRTGIRVAQLGSEELIELFYKIFNPGDLEKPIQLEKNQ